MISRFYSKKTKIFASCILLAVVAIAIISSHDATEIISLHKCPQLYVFERKENIYIVEPVKTSLTYDAQKETGETDMKTDVLQVYPPRTKETFKVEMKTDLWRIVNPSTPKSVVIFNGYLLENKNLCTSVTTLTILVIVLSVPNHFERRNIIRETWANGRSYSSYGTTRVLFLLGTTSAPGVQCNIEKEFKLYGDILQGDITDSVLNLTHKSVMGYKWASERCRNAKYVIKTDDDIVINMFHVFRSFVLELTVNQTHVICRRGIKCDIDRRSLKPDQFVGVNYYPSFCSGQFVMMLNDIVPYLYEAARKSPFFWIDDVFVYGIVMNNIPSLKYKQIELDDIGRKNITRTKPEWSYKYIDTENDNQMRDVWLAMRKHYD